MVAIRTAVKPLKFAGSIQILQEEEMPGRRIRRQPKPKGEMGHDV
jgi:hypothetical protein